MFEIISIKGIADNQIFQQTDGYADIPVEGKLLSDNPAFAGKAVWIHLTREEDSTYVILPVRADLHPDGTFSALLPAVPAGGLYTLTCQLGEKNAVTDWDFRGEARFHLGVGDLFLIAGQSNSAGYGKTPAYDPTDPAVHLYRNNGSWHTAAHPLNDSTGSLHPVNAEWATSGTSPYVRFASTLRRVLGYPIGLIQASKGDTYMYQWSRPDYPDPEALKQGKEAQMGELWRLALDMVAAAGGKIAGVLWYQGCNDADFDCWAHIYAHRFDDLVTSFREAAGLPDLPFYTVQLNKHAAEQPAHSWATVKEAQRTAPDRLPHVYTAVSHDQPLSDRIHNNSAANAVIGERLAWLALENEYGRNYFGSAPTIRRAVLDPQTGILRLTFDHVYGYMVTMGNACPDITAEAWDTPSPRRLTVLSTEASADSLIVRLDPAGLPSGDPDGNFHKLTVSFGCTPSGAVTLPIDRITGMPPLGFYRFPVEVQNAKK